MRSSAPPVTAALLRRWPLPQPDESDDKEGRGQVLVIGGTPELPGALILAAMAALRSGAGKLRVVAGESIALGVGVAVPEARVFAMKETRRGGIARRADREIVELARGARTVLIGPGALDERAVLRVVRRIVREAPEATLVIDAGALMCVRDEPECLHPLEGRVVLTPHAGEMASMLRIEKRAVQEEPLATARRAAAAWGAIVALKGRETFIAAPDGEAFCNRIGNVGLATSGSGDTLSGVIAGLLARGTPPLQAATWGVYLHARAGDRLAARMGRLGFLARELLAEIPPAMAELARSPCAR